MVCAAQNRFLSLLLTIVAIVAIVQARVQASQDEEYKSQLVNHQRGRGSVQRADGSSVIALKRSNFDDVTMEPISKRTDPDQRMQSEPVQQGSKISKVGHKGDKYSSQEMDDINARKYSNRREPLHGNKNNSLINIQHSQAADHGVISNNSHNAMDSLKESDIPNTSRSSKLSQTKKDSNANFIRFLGYIISPKNKMNIDKGKTLRTDLRNRSKKPSTKYINDDKIPIENIRYQEIHKDAGNDLSHINDSNYRQLNKMNVSASNKTSNGVNNNSDEIVGRARQYPRHKSVSSLENVRLYQLSEANTRMSNSPVSDTKAAESIIEPSYYIEPPRLRSAASQQATDATKNERVINSRGRENIPRRVDVRRHDHPAIRRKLSARVPIPIRRPEKQQETQQVSKIIQKPLAASATGKGKEKGHHGSHKSGHTNTEGHKLGKGNHDENGYKKGSKGIYDDKHKKDHNDKGRSQHDEDHHTEHHNSKYDNGKKGTSGYQKGTNKHHHKGHKDAGFKKSHHITEYMKNTKHYEDIDHKDYHGEHDHFDKFFDKFKKGMFDSGSFKGDKHHSKHHKDGHYLKGHQKHHDKLHKKELDHNSHHKGHRKHGYEKGQHKKHGKQDASDH